MDAASNQRFFVARDDKRIGQFSLGQIEAMLVKGDLSYTDLVWTATWEGWRPIISIPSVSALQQKQASWMDLAPQSALPALHQPPLLPARHDKLRRGLILVALSVGCIALLAIAAGPSNVRTFFRMWRYFPGAFAHALGVESKSDVRNSESSKTPIPSATLGTSPRSTLPPEVSPSERVVTPTRESAEKLPSLPKPTADALGDQTQAFKNAKDATARGDIKRSDFWIARYWGLSWVTENLGPPEVHVTKEGYNNLIPLFRQRKDLLPIAFMSGRYDDSFIDFFRFGTCVFWGAPDKAIKGENFIIRYFLDDKYSAIIHATPRLEAWSILKEPPFTAIIPFGVNPVITLGKIDNGHLQLFKDAPLYTEDNPIHFVWPIEMHDLDEDGVPELWVRYTIALADGFSQELKIYKIKDNELVLMKQFSGQAEGIVRRLDGNKVEVGTGFSSNRNNGAHMDFDRTHLETWEYRDGKFVKIAAKNVPHILRSKAWEKYYGISPF
jgi:hypothetical protein